MKMLQIRVNDIQLQEKDLIEIDTIKDFEEIMKRCGFVYCFNLRGVLYVISNEVAYTHRLVSDDKKYTRSWRECK